MTTLTVDRGVPFVRIPKGFDDWSDIPESWNLYTYTALFVGRGRRELRYECIACAGHDDFTKLLLQWNRDGGDDWAYYAGLQR